MLSGLVLTFHEAVVYRGPERWGLIILFGSMMGLPAFLRMDEKRRADGDESTPTPPQPELRP